MRIFPSFVIFDFMVVHNWFANVDFFVYVLEKLHTNNLVKNRWYNKFTK